MIIDLMVTDSLERFYPYSTASFFIYSITYLEYSLLFSERMLFAIFLRGGVKWICTHARRTLKIYGRGIFSKIGGGENSIYMHFYIILANEVEILVWVIYPEI